MAEPSAMAIAGLSVAGLSLLLHVLQHWWNRRTFWMKREEDVSTRIFYDPVMPDRAAWVVQAYVVNTGTRDLYVRAVSLCFSCPELGTAEEHAMREAEEKGSPIRPGDERLYSIGGNEVVDWPHISALGPRDLQVRIDTPPSRVKGASCKVVDGRRWSWINSDCDEKLSQEWRRRIKQRGA